MPSLNSQQVNTLREAARLGVLRRLQGANLVLTGKMSMSRTNMEKLILACGGIPGSKVTSSTNLLIVGDEGATAGGGETIKIRDARSMGVPTMSEEEFVAYLAPDWWRNDDDDDDE